MAEQKITVKMDPLQVQQLQDFVRDEIRKERAANMRVEPKDSALRVRVETLLDALMDKYSEDDDIRAGVVSSWLRGVLA